MQAWKWSGVNSPPGSGAAAVRGHLCWGPGTLLWAGLALHGTCRSGGRLYRRRCCRGGRACPPCRPHRRHLTRARRGARPLAAGTPYEGGLFRMKLVVGSDFPNAPPKGATWGPGEGEVGADRAGQGQSGQRSATWPQPARRTLMHFKASRACLAPPCHCPAGYSASRIPHSSRHRSPPPGKTPTPFPRHHPATPQPSTRTLFPPLQATF